MRTGDLLALVERVGPGERLDRARRVRLLETLHAYVNMIGMVDPGPVKDLDPELLAARLERPARLIRVLAELDAVLPGDRLRRLQLRRVL